MFNGLYGRATQGLVSKLHHCLNIQNLALWKNADWSDNDESICFL